MPASGEEGDELAPTPDQALEDWFDRNWGVFAGDGVLATSDIMIDNVSVLDESRSVLSFFQRVVDDRGLGKNIPVRGTFGRALAERVEGGWAVYQVAWSGLDIPAAGLPDPVIDEAEARLIAETESSAAREGRVLHWKTDSLVALGDAESERPRDARLAWAVRGLQTRMDERGLEVFVDAVAGTIIDERHLGPAQLHAAQSQTITGTVSGDVFQ